MSELELLEKKINEYSNKVARLMDAMSLINNKSKIIEELHNLNNQCTNSSLAIEQTKEVIEDFRQNQVPRFNNILARCQRLHLVMLDLLNELDEEEEEAAKATLNANVQNLNNNFSTPNRSCFTPQVGDTTTPRILLSAYKQSPFVRRRGPVALQFIDFEATIDQIEFNKMPPYLKGREHLAELQLFLDNIIIKCFTQKYALFHKNRDIVRNPQDLLQWKLYHEQESYFPGQIFITQGDISAITSKMLDKKMINRLGMLRHLKIIQEQRKKSTICYIWLKLIQT